MQQNGFEKINLFTLRFTEDKIMKDDKMLNYIKSIKNMPAGWLNTTTID
jgi:hypothetical protein